MKKTALTIFSFLLMLCWPTFAESQSTDDYKDQIEFPLFSEHISCERYSPHIVQIQILISETDTPHYQIFLDKLTVAVRNDGKNYTSVKFHKFLEKNGISPLYDSAVILVPQAEDKQLWEDELAKLADRIERYKEWISRRYKPYRILPDKGLVEEVKLKKVVWPVFDAWFGLEGDEIYLRIGEKGSVSKYYSFKLQDISVELRQDGCDYTSVEIVYPNNDSGTAVFIGEYVKVTALVPLADDVEIWKTAITYKLEKYEELKKKSEEVRKKQEEEQDQYWQKKRILPRYE